MNNNKRILKGKINNNISSINPITKRKNKFKSSLITRNNKLFVKRSPLPRQVNPLQEVNNVHTSKFINKLPLIITQSGIYKLCQNLTYSALGTSITIQTSNVTLDLNSHSITITNPNSTAISIQNSNNVTVVNGSLYMTGTPELTEAGDDISSQGTGIEILNSNKVQLRDLFISKFLFGVYTSDSNNINVEYTLIKGGDNVTLNELNGDGEVIGTFDVGGTLSNLYFDEETNGINIDNVQIDNPLSVWGPGGIVFVLSNLVRVSNLKSRNSDIWYRQGNNGIFSKVNILMDDLVYPFSLFQLGGANGPDYITNDIIIKDSTLLSRSNTGGGLSLSKNNNVLVRNNVFKTDRTDVSAVDTDTVSIGIDGSQECSWPVDIKNIKLKGNLISGNSTQLLFVTSSPDELILDPFNEIDGTGCSSCEGPEACVINPTRTDGIVIEENTFQQILRTGQTLVGDIAGIYFNTVINSVIKGNDINNINGNGILLKNSEVNVVKENTITSNSLTGIELNNSHRNVILNNIISNNSSGILLVVSEGNNINNNVIIGNDIGIFFNFNSNSNNISNNTINNNVVYGVFFVNSDNNTIDNNSINDNGNGILFSNSDNNTIDSNTINDNVENGIFFVNSNSNNISNNTINDNGIDGILFSNSDNNTIEGNTINNNVVYGIFFSSSNNNTIDGNTINDNGSDGIFFGSSDNNTIDGNTINDNDGNGIHFNPTSNNNTYSNNTLSGNEPPQINDQGGNTDGDGNVIIPPPS